MSIWERCGPLVLFQTMCLAPAVYNHMDLARQKQVHALFKVPKVQYARFALASNLSVMLKVDSIEMSPGAGGGGLPK